MVNWIHNEFMRSSFLPKCKPKISALPNKQGSQPKNCLHSPKYHKKKCYDPCFYGRAEILIIFGLHVGRNNDLINSFWIQLTFSKEIFQLNIYCSSTYTFHNFSVYLVKKSIWPSTSSKIFQDSVYIVTIRIRSLLFSIYHYKTYYLETFSLQWVIII